MEHAENYGGLEAEFTGLSESQVVILPIPYDKTSTWGKGADKGPQAILNASANMEVYDIETGSEIYKSGIHTASSVQEKSSPEKMVNAVEEIASKYIGLNKFLVGLGGEHSVTTGLVRAHAGQYKNLSVLQLDAHTDLRPEYEGTPYNHACVMSRVKEICPVVQVGIRSMDTVELPFVEHERLFLADKIQDNDHWMDQAINLLTQDVYITFDLDVFDPSIMPSTGTPEPGGMLWYPVLKFLRKVIEKRNLLGFDVVELAPVESNRSPDFMAAKLIYKMLSYRFSTFLK